MLLLQSWDDDRWRKHPEFRTKASPLAFGGMNSFRPHARLTPPGRITDDFFALKGDATVDRALSTARSVCAGATALFGRRVGLQPAKLFDRNAWALPEAVLCHWAERGQLARVSLGLSWPAEPVCIKPGSADRCSRFSAADGAVRILRQSSHTRPAKYNHRERAKPARNLHIGQTPTAQYVTLRYAVASTRSARSGSGLNLHSGLSIEHGNQSNASCA